MQIVTAVPQPKFLLAPLLARAVRYGQVFQCEIRHNSPQPLLEGLGIGPLYMRVKPTGFLLNSNTIGDVISRGDILTVNLERNTLYYMKGDTPIVLKNAQIVVTEEETK